MNLAALYRYRFASGKNTAKVRIWQALCAGFFQDLIGEGQTILDLACGYGEFINAIRGTLKLGVDLNPDTPRYLAANVASVIASADAIPFQADSVDVVFTSNFLEHLKDKRECDRVLTEILRVLRPGGRFIVMGPNIRYVVSKYWDFYDHQLPLSHLSLEEGLVQAGYMVRRVIPRFLPYTARTPLPQHPILVRLYLKVPLAWNLFGRQFLLIAAKPSA